MNENEQLARWLGLETTIDAGERLMVLKKGLWYPLDFRSSNEWAGALLEKLSELRDPMYLAHAAKGWYFESEDIDTRLAPNWRSAVVDAALEVIKRSGSATGEA